MSYHSTPEQRYARRGPVHQARRDSRSGEYTYSKHTSRRSRGEGSYVPVEKSSKSEGVGLERKLRRSGRGGERASSGASSYEQKPAEKSPAKSGLEGKLKGKSPEKPSKQYDYAPAYSASSSEKSSSGLEKKVEKEAPTEKPKKPSVSWYNPPEKEASYCPTCAPPTENYDASCPDGTCNLSSRSEKSASGSCSTGRCGGQKRKRRH